MTQNWTKEERQLLLTLHIDPMRCNRDKLLTLKAFFEGGGTAYQITIGKKALEPPISHEFACKVRDLAEDGKLAWLTGSAQTTIPPPNTAHLFFRSMSVRDFRKGNRVARYATVEVVNDSEVEATGCWGWADIATTGLKVPLHWAGTPITAAETDAPRISINQRKPARLDVAFTMAAPGKEQLSNRSVTTSGDIVTYPRDPRKTVWNSKGCWLAQPAALYNPDTGGESYLPPGDHRVKVTVGCLNGQGDITADYIITSPSSWEGLDFKPA